MNPKLQSKAILGATRNLQRPACNLGAPKSLNTSTLENKVIPDEIPDLKIDLGTSKHANTALTPCKSSKKQPLLRGEKDTQPPMGGVPPSRKPRMFPHPTEEGMHGLRKIDIGAGFSGIGRKSRIRRFEVLRVHH